MHINIKGGGGCMRKKLGFGECSVTSCVPGRILTLWLPPLRKGKSDSEQKSNFGGWRRRRRRRTLAERPRESLVMRVPVTANPTKKGQLRFHSRLKNTGHGSNSLIFSALLSLSLCVLQPFLLNSTPRSNTVIPVVVPVRSAIALPSNPMGYARPNPIFIII